MAQLLSNLGTYVPDNLFASLDVPVLVKPVTLLTGQGVIKRGTVLGKITKAIGAPVKTGTGNGTCTDVSLGATAKIGTYTMTCTAAVGNGGTFSVVDPDNMQLTNATVGTAYAGPINFKINDGTTDFIVGDKFTIAVAAGSGKYKVVDSTSVDGSQVAERVLIADTDTTDADVITEAYISGHFNREALIFGGEDTADDHEVALRDLNIILSDNITY